MEISDKQWKYINELVDGKNALIKDLEAKLEVSETENHELIEEIDEITAEKGKVKTDNESIKEELRIRTQELKRTNTSLSLVLNKLNESLNIMETHGLANRKHKITTYEINQMFDIKG